MDSNNKLIFGPSSCPSSDEVGNEFSDTSKFDVYLVTYVLGGQGQNLPPASKSYTVRKGTSAAHEVLLRFSEETDFDPTNLISIKIEKKS